MILAPIRRTAALLPLLASLLTLPAYANGHGGGGGGGSGASLSFTTNLVSAGRSDRYVKIDCVFDTASPEVEGSIKSLMPKIKSQMILIISSMKDEALRTREGKNELATAIRKAVNKMLDESEKTGVKEVLFTSFLIQ